MKHEHLIEQARAIVEAASEDITESKLWDQLRDDPRARRLIYRRFCSVEQLSRAYFSYAS